jgi:DNA-binding response OmpR family regulator
MKRILIVEDEIHMMNLLKIHLGKEYHITNAKDGQTALDLIEKQSFDLIILDVMLPYVSGWTVCKRIRETDDTPILMLTARTDLADKVKGLELGADDYLVKPFEFEELNARIKALLRRIEQSMIKNQKNDNKYVYLNGSFLIDLDSRQLIVNQELVELTATEFEILSLLASNPRRVFTRDILLDQIWEHSESRDLRNVDTHIKNIRTKLRMVVRDINFIQTVWGVGYKLNIQEDI